MNPLAKEQSHDLLAHWEIRDKSIQCPFSQKITYDYCRMSHKRELKNPPKDAKEKKTRKNGKMPIGIGKYMIFCI